MHMNLQIIQIKINSKLKSLLLKRILLRRKKSELQLKSENFNYLIVIARSGATKQSLVLFCYCESRPFVNGYIKKQMNFLIAENFVFF